MEASSAAAGQPAPQPDQTSKHRGTSCIAQRHEDDERYVKRRASRSVVERREAVPAGRAGPHSASRDRHREGGEHLRGHSPIPCQPGASKAEHSRRS